MCPGLPDELSSPWPGPERLSCPAAAQQMCKTVFFGFFFFDKNSVPWVTAGSGVRDSQLVSLPGAVPAGPCAPTPPSRGPVGAGDPEHGSLVGGHGDPVAAPWDWSWPGMCPREAMGPQGVLWWKGKPDTPGWKPVPYWGLPRACLPAQATGRRCSPSHEHPRVGASPAGSPSRVQTRWLSPSR